MALAISVVIALLVGAGVTAWWLTRRRAPVRTEAARDVAVAEVAEAVAVVESQAEAHAAAAAEAAQAAPPAEDLAAGAQAVAHWLNGE